MSYKADLQTNNTNLQTMLTSAKQLPYRKYSIETWNLTLNDNTKINEELHVVDIITFYVDNIKYQAINGMTWGDLISNECNPGNFSTGLDGDIIYTNESNSSAFMLYNSNHVYSSELIIANGQYRMSSTGWGDDEDW